MEVQNFLFGHFRVSSSCSKHNGLFWMNVLYFSDIYSITSVVVLQIARWRMLGSMLNNESCSGIYGFVATLTALNRRAVFGVSSTKQKNENAKYMFIQMLRGTGWALSFSPSSEKLWNMVHIWSDFFYVTILSAINESIRLSSRFTPSRSLFLKCCQTRDDNRLHGYRSVVKLFTSQSFTSCHVGRCDGASSAAACARVWSLTRQQTRGNKHARQWWLRQVFLTEPFSRFSRLLTAGGRRTRGRKKVRARRWVKTPRQLSESSCQRCPENRWCLQNGQEQIKG